MMRWMLALVVSATAAHASPLEPLWQTKVHCDNPRIVEWRDHLAWIDHGRVQRAVRATGKLAKPLVLAKIAQVKGPALGWETHARIEGVVGDDLVIHHGHEFAVVDGTTGKVRWRAEQTRADGGLPYLVVTGGDVVWVHPAHLGKGDPPVFLERLALETGKQLWRGEMPADTGQVDWAAADDGRLYVVTSPDSIGPKVHVAAFDLGTGKRVWTQALTSKKTTHTSRDAPGAFVADGGKLYYVMPNEGLDILDGPSGKLLGRVPLASVPEGARSLTIARGRAYVASPTEVTVVELKTQAIAWTVKNDSTDVHVTATALYITDRDVATAHALADGRVLATWGVYRAEQVYAGAGTPALLLCDDSERLIALDPTGAVTPVEHAVVTGRLVCGTCKTHVFPPLAVRLGDTTATTDKRGNFQITVDARGTRRLSFDLPTVEAPIGWMGDIDRAIRFTNKRKYALRNLRVVLDCGPLETCTLDD